MTECGESSWNHKTWKHWRIEFSVQLNPCGDSRTQSTGIEGLTDEGALHSLRYAWEKSGWKKRTNTSESLLFPVILVGT